MNRKKLKQDCFEYLGALNIPKIELPELARRTAVELFIAYEYNSSLAEDIREYLKEQKYSEELDIASGIHPLI